MLSPQKIVSALFSLGIVTISLPSFAADAINMRHQSATLLSTMLPLTINNFAANNNPNAIKEINRSVGRDKTLHIRLQQTYNGYPVFGSDMIMHVPAKELHDAKSSLASFTNSNNVTMNGFLYKNLTADLAATPAALLTQANANLAMKKMTESLQAQSFTVNNPESRIIVFIDKNKRAHYAYWISLTTNNKNILHHPNVIVDVATNKEYAAWDDVRDEDLQMVKAGGTGGNEKVGLTFYDGSENHAPTFMVSRNPLTKVCYLKDSEIAVKDTRDEDFNTIQFSCPLPVSKYNNLYWHGGQGNELDGFIGADPVNGGYSPSNDAYYSAHVVTNMYRDWYGDYLWQNESGKRAKLTIWTHINDYANATCCSTINDNIIMQLGDGGSRMHPLTSLGVVAHEASHHFTYRHSFLILGTAAGLNDAFSDMGAQAVEYYVNKTNTWLIGGEIMKENGKALRDMANPTKDCNGREPGDFCSIDNVKQYVDGLDSHYIAGVYNKMFYILAHLDGWNTKKAFDVMVEANMHYWTYDVSFTESACGAINAAADLNNAHTGDTYNADAIAYAFNAVGIDSSHC